MKKILVGLVVASLLLAFQMVTVHGTSFSYKDRLGDMISSIENFIFRGEHDNRHKKLEEDLAVVYEKVSGITINDVEQYKGNYLSNLTEKKESMQLQEPFTEYTKQKNQEIDSEIKEDIATYISELLEKENHEIKNRKGE